MHMIIEMFWHALGLDLGYFLQLVADNIIPAFMFTCFFAFRFGADSMKKQLFSWLLLFAFFDLLAFAGAEFIGKTHTVETVVLIGTAMPVLLAKTNMENKMLPLTIGVMLLASALFG